jgi:hypothetical protein
LSSIGEEERKREGGRESESEGESESEREREGGRERETFVIQCTAAVNQWGLPPPAYRVTFCLTISAGVVLPINLDDQGFPVRLSHTF